MFTYMAKIERVVDGDTVDVSIDLGFDIWHKLRLRLAGIDAAEHNTVRGKVTKEFMKTALEGKTVKITTYSPDKYGRYLAEIWLSSEVSINKQLIANNVVKPYGGDTKSGLWATSELEDGNINKILL